MKHVKTFEEYKYVNIGDKTYHGDIESEKDINEPFFNKPKKKYRKKKQDIKNKKMFDQIKKNDQTRSNFIDQLNAQEEERAISMAKL